ncbi:energy-coupling factor transport system substrate-specific component [Knoellia remsis]|uniref:Energy-coupling factor transport system substrate-specific component n=1 Tax=Knoellia remsis TaxID=407159 RepID=A0A2T0UGQ1_9MICO|nr:ECF transporter S component [Knoellia remsis]PRY57133.1 energy-coupling factor transport system substrate-specific component [Knoellia remsis]
MAAPTTTSTPAHTGRGGSILATRPLMGWRTVDILTIAFLGAALGIAFWGWGVFYNGPLSAISFAFPPMQGLLTGPWFIAGVVGGLVVRRPGAALFCEVVAALVSMIPGTEWGATVLVSGIVQGLGTELVFALLGYRAFGIAAAVLAGAMAGPFAAFYESFTWIADWSFGWKLAYAAFLAISGAVIAGAGGWLLTRALAAAGALNAFPPGQEQRESRAV